MRIRRAVRKDVAAFMKFKDKYPMPLERNTSREGFLMGSSEKSYLKFVASDEVWVLEDVSGEAVGYAIVLRDETLRASSIWEKRKEIDWGEFSLESLERGRTCFYEQLAIAPNRRSLAYGGRLGIKCLAMAMKDHDYSFTTVVRKPVCNLASRGFVLAAGYHQVGTVEEDYPQLKAVVSDVFAMSREDFIHQMEGPYASIAKKALGGQSLRGGN